LERAHGYYRAGEFERARIEYQNVLQKEPENVAALERMAFIWLERGAPVRAFPFLLKLRTSAPGRLDLRVKLAEVLLSIGKVADARREALAVLERSSSFPDAIVLLTEAVRNEEEYKEAERALQSMDRNRVSYHIASANLMLLQGNSTSARSALQRAIALDPKSPASHAAMASLYELQQNPAMATVELKNAAELSPVRALARVKYAGIVARTGAVTEAIEYLTEINRQAPDYLPGWRGLAEITLAAKKHNDALDYIEKLLRHDPSDYEGQILRARVWLAQGDVKRAVEGLEGVGKDFPALGLASYHLALAYVRNNEHEKAMVALQEAVSRNRDNVEAVLMLAGLHLRAGSAQPAAAAMLELVGRRPNVLQAYPLLVEALRPLGRLEATAQAINRMLETSPKNAQLRYFLGLLSIALKQPANARQEFEKVLGESPDSLPAMAELINLDIDEGHHADALARVRSLIAKTPEASGARFLEARAHAAAGRWGDVEASVLKALELGSENPAAYALLADSFAVRKETPDIERRLEMFLGQRLDDELAVVVGAHVHLQWSKFTQARDIYENYLARKPSASVVLNNLASLYNEQLLMPDRALELARKARSLEPGSPAIADTLGWILYKRKEFPEAWTLLQESGRKMAHDADMQFRYGMAAKAMGKDDVALAAFRIAAGAQTHSANQDEAKRQIALLELTGLSRP